MSAEQTSVLVVGGGLVGLSAAVFLSKRGVPTVLAERHANCSPHPRAMGFTPRTRELYRAAGLEPELPPAPGRLGAGIRRVRVESLAGKWFEELPWGPQLRSNEPAKPVPEYSPCGGIGLAQNRLELILRQKANEFGADIRFSTELVSFTQDCDGVQATLRTADGETSTVSADYLVAADGNRSPVREALGVSRDGQGYMHTSRSVLFRAPLQQYLESGVRQFAIDQAGIKGMLTTYGDDNWGLFLTGDDTDRDDDSIRDAVLCAIGRADVDVEVLASGLWEVSAFVAQRYSVGRVFLAGDAAHTLPPNRGAFSANTGVEDAHNLAWKLASVHKGESTPALLNTYDVERRPIAWLCYHQIFAHNDGRRPRVSSENVSVIDDQAMAFGHLYRSGAVLGAGDDLPPAKRPDEWAGQPGTRAPHFWLTINGHRVSTLDLFGRTWVLVTADDRWATPARLASERTGVSLDYRYIGSDAVADQPDALQHAYGLATGGAALIRPDGYLAWRTRSLPPDPTGTLTEALHLASFASQTG